MKVGAGFLKELTQLLNPQARLTKKKRERTLINKITNETGEPTTSNEEIQIITGESYKQLYAKNLGEKGKFLEIYKLPKRKQEGIEKLNRPITSKEIKSIIKNNPKHKVQGWVTSQWNSTKHLKKN